MYAPTYVCGSGGGTNRVLRAGPLSKAASDGFLVSEPLQIRIHSDAALPVLVYLPGIHGDWTLVSSFRAAVAGRVRFVEFTYPRTVAWTLADYAEAVTGALLTNEIRQGWLLAESFGSLVAWEMIRRSQESKPQPEGARKPAFTTQGLILAGGFARHPWPWGARLMRWVGERLAMSFYQRMLRVYAFYAKFRHRDAPETLASIGEFVARRTALDRQAMRARLELVTQADARPVARRTMLPVRYLAGVVDPLVPGPYVRRWLRCNCPGYRGGKTFWFADHNVLATAARQSAETVLEWMAVGKRR
jgi:pimeloyl-ACP methyl ester carboxylesterase